MGYNYLILHTPTAPTDTREDADSLSRKCGQGVVVPDRAASAPGEYRL